MNIQTIMFISVAAFTIALFTIYVLEISKLFTQFGVVVFCILLTTSIYFMLIKKKNMDENKILTKSIKLFGIVSIILLLVRASIYIYEVGGLKTAKGLFTFLGILVGFIILTQIIAMNNTFNEIDEIYKLIPNSSKPSNIKPSNIKPNNIKPSNIKPSNIKPSNIKATNAK